ncbi:uncharacterized protein DS421_10g300510 [Arachis hypogaea]|nr:uncharacterized protein DS421_10g300510 [Arachis hypogaea]
MEFRDSCRHKPPTPTFALRRSQPALGSRQSALLSPDIRATPPLHVSASVTALSPLTFLALRPLPSCLQSHCRVSTSPRLLLPSSSSIGSDPFVLLLRILQICDLLLSLVFNLQSSLFRLQQKTPGFCPAAAERRIDPSLATVYWVLHFCFLEFNCSDSILDFFWYSHES